MLLKKVYNVWKNTYDRWLKSGGLMLYQPRHLHWDMEHQKGSQGILCGKVTKFSFNALVGHQMSQCVKKLCLFIDKTLPTPFLVGVIHLGYKKYKISWLIGNFPLVMKSWTKSFTYLLRVAMIPKLALSRWNSTGLHSRIPDQDHLLWPHLNFQSMLDIIVHTLMIH